MTELPNLAEASDELYACDPADFVARRDALAREARDRKDRALAQAIKKLRRPTVGAWYVNVAVRAGLISLQELLRLGHEMREAQSNLDFKRVVARGPQRADVERRVLSDLSAHLAGIGLTATPAALEEVRSTLRAAVADADAAAAVQSGRLERPLEYDGLTGFGAVVVPDAAWPRLAEERVTHGEEDRSSRRAREAEEEAAASRAALEAARVERERAAARRALDEARQRLAAAETAAAVARADYDRVAEELAAAADAAAEVDRTEAADAVAAHDRAARA